jgi:hypothetical protein
MVPAQWWYHYVNMTVGEALSRGSGSLYRGQLYKPRFLPQLSPSFPMPSYTEEDVTNALNALVNGKYKPFRRAASVFQIPYSTLQYRSQKRKTRKESHVSQQILTPIEESTLENWIYRAAKLGAPITLQLVKILASEI